jgi:diguanylate cyclase (GGDEF)-like protein
MVSETDITLDELESLARELLEVGALAGPVTSNGEDHAKGLAFLIRDLTSDRLHEILERVDLRIPLTENSMATLEALKQVVDENRELRELSVTDTLTGLFNRRFFRDRLSVEMQRVRRSEKPCSLIMMDLDRFKSVNDTHGHQAGDELLRQVAEIIRNNIRAVDMPVRYGGDEMAVILPDTSLIAAHKMADRMRAEFEKNPQTAQYGVTASLGLATHHHWDSEDVEGLIRRADQALYKAKDQGGNMVWFLEIDRDKEKPTEVTVSERDSLFLGLPK